MGARTLEVAREQACDRRIGSVDASANSMLVGVNQPALKLNQTY